MSGRTKRGPGRPRTSDSAQSLSPYPNSPLTPDSEESFIMSIREGGRSTRVRNRTKPQPAKKTRVNAQSKLKSPIKSSPIGSCTGRTYENHDISMEHGNLMDMSPYSVTLHGSGQLLFENLTSDAVSQKTTGIEDELARSKVCSFCNCGVEMRMFHGKLQRYAPTPGFNPSKRLQSRHQRQNSGCEPFRDKLDLDPFDNRPCVEEQREPQPIITRRGPGRPPGRGRRKGIVVVGLPLRSANQELTVDKTSFGTVKEKDLSDIFEEDGYTWAHHCCAAWSEGVSQTDSYDLINVDKAVVNALSEQCNHCNRFGASVVCQIPRCGKTYHYPCAASSGSFQDIKSMTMLCPDHLEDAGRLAGSEAECVLCGEAKDFAELIFCTSCGRHYHGRCLEPSVDLTSVIRMGWQCPDCKVCQGCRQPGDDNRMLVCDLCDTGYHTYCLDPPMSTIPKTGWKCLSCRRCEDCGSNTPGGGPTSRWHHNFSVCDSCYQQRNKGLFCPLCGRAYRQFTDVAMVQCLSCEKWIHASCDDIDKDDYQKYNSKDLPYFCPSCKPKKGSLQLLDRNHGIELGFNDQQPTDVDMSFDNNPEEDKRTLTIAAGCMSPVNMDDDLLLSSSLDDLNPLRHFDPVLDVTDTETIPIPNLDNIEPEKVQLSEKLPVPLDEEMEVVVKPDHELDMLATPADLSDSCSLPSFSVVDRHLSEPKAPAPSHYQHHNSFVTPPKILGKRKLAPGKVKSKTGGTPARKKSKHGKPGRPPSKLKSKAAPQTSPGKENVASASNAVEQNNKEEESESLHTTLVLFSADDEFTSRQDMCLCCGSFGKDAEGQLIMCSQCGQSYHPYCVNVKINKVILTKGWRCLDCTLCEGCGKGSDEARLLLCDSCDISYHTYCLDPPLGHVPQGGWKCKWCVNCSDCGATTPGLGCQWMSNYTQCGPCASKTTCPVCKIKYNTNDLMIQCSHCERWLHGSCDGLVNEEELDCAADHGYHCLYCRPKTKRALVGVSGPPSPKATVLHHYRPQSSLDSDTPVPSGKPLHPCQRRNNNLVELKLSSHFNKIHMSEPFVGNNIELTESGVRHMNKLKLPPGGARRRVIKNKVKPKRFGLPVSPVKKNSFTTGHIQEKDAIFNRTFTEDGDTLMANEMESLGHQPSLVPTKVSRPRQSGVGRPGVGGFVLRGRGSGGRRLVGRGARGTNKRKVPVLSMPASRGQSHFNNQGNHLPRSFTSGLNSPTKQPSFNHLEASFNHGSNDSWAADSSDENGLQDAYPKWMQEAFFGKDLLDTLGKDKRVKPIGKAVLTPDQGTNKDPFALRQGFVHQEQQGNSGQVPYPLVTSEEQQQTLYQPGYQRTSSHSTVPQKQHTSLGLSEHEIWSPSHALNLPEEVPNPDALYRSLDMLTDDLPPATQNDSHSAATRGLSHTTSQHLSSTATSQQHVAPVAAASTWNQAQTRPQGNDLDILDTADILPHVDGQEVEEIFAGIEREMTNRVFNFLDTDINDSVVVSNQEQFAPSVSNSAVPHHGVGLQSGQHPVAAAYGQGVTNHAYNTGSTHFQGVPGGPGYQHGTHNQIDGFPSTVVSGPLGFGQSSTFPRSGDLDDLPRERRRPPSPRTDPLKQQQKWEEDEKLGAMATISPVLYANLEHANLKQEYPEWANRYRAIARLWRKLSVEQRDPYRLKARDNRVRLKDQGKKLIARNDENSKAEGQKPAQNNPQQQQQQQIPSQEQQQTQLSQQELQQTQPTQQQVQQVPQQMQQSQELSQQMLQQVPHPSQDPRQSHQYEQYVPMQTNADGSLFPVTSVMPVPLTPTTPARSTTPVTPGTPGAMTPTTPTTPTPTHGQVLSHSQIALSHPAAAVNHPQGGKTVSSKGKKTKEEKEREKELRKQRLRIQQEQERQWKILQQRRALEQQRQQQQQQQENTLLRQELRKQQQAKGTKGTDEQKKKRLPKGSKRASCQASKGQRHADPTVSNLGLHGENSERSFQGTQGVQQQVLPVESSFSAAPRANANALASSTTQLQNESSHDFLAHYDGQRDKPFKEGEIDTRESNCRPEISTPVTDELRSVNADASQRYQGPFNWQKETIEETVQHTDRAIWEHPQGHHQLEQPRRPSDHARQPQEAARQSVWGCEDLQPEASRDHLGSNNLQNGTTLIEQHIRPSQESLQEQEQVAHGNFSSHEQLAFQGEKQQSWLPGSHGNPTGIPVTQSSMQGQQVGGENEQIGQQPSIPDSIQGLPYPVQQEVALNSSEQHHQQPSVDLQQSSQQIAVMHWQQELSQVRAQVAAADLLPPQSIAPHSAPPPPPPPPPPPLPASQQQQQQTGPLQAYEINTGWPSQQGQVPPPPPPPPHVHPQSTTPFSQQPQQLHSASNLQPAISQMPFQPAQQPPIQIAPNQLPALPMTVQSQENQLHQPQQDVAQRQQREQLIRAQQQQFFQMLQQQQVLQQQQQQQQQQSTAIQPGFVRARFNQVANTKDLPEIDTEEEHQERLRFLYRQRQAQKQQQMQMHAQLMQQAWIQQQLTTANGQGVVPSGMIPVDTSNPQLMQQFAQQMHPQMSDVTQQQLFAEYQRRIQQRQDLGKQTVQYDKVLQEFQQQQGIAVGGAHPTAPFIEVPQQRFAVRQPTPMVQPGLKPIIPYGLDGQFVGQQQQFYKMQLQQQMMMQQPKSELLQNNTSQDSPSTGKVDTPKSHVEAKDDSGESLNRSGSVVQSDAINDSQENVQSSEDHSRQRCEKTETETAEHQDNLKSMSDSTTAMAPVSTFEEEASVSHCKKDNLSDEGSGGHDIEATAESKEGTSGIEKETLNSSTGTAFGEGCGKRTGEIGNDNGKKKGDEDDEHTKVEENDNSHVDEEVVEKEPCKASNSRDDLPNDTSSDVGCKEVASTRSSSVEVNQSSDEAQTSRSDVEEIQKNKLEEGEGAKPLRHQESKLSSGAETIHDTNQAPAQALHVPSQGLPVPAPQPQHFIVQQQFLAFQQQFLQMQQQRQVLVQQYQQLQQQLHQAGGQDPVLAAQVMTVQSQGQVLQQQMVQAWQQIQLIQHQLQLAGAPNQQQYSVQQQQPQASQSQLGSQWPQGVIQGHQIAAQPGVIAARPGAMAMQHPLQARGSLTDKVLDETPKQGRGRSKSKDTPLQPSPHGPPNSGMDWPPPKAKQTKPRQRRSKKAGPKADPDLELQQQMLQQQLYQQMEQRHRLMQQKQGLYVEQGKHPGQQPSPSLTQHVVDNPGVLAQTSMDMPHPTRPLSHTPELQQGLPSRPDSQIGLPPGTAGSQMPSGPQVPLPPNMQIPPGHPQKNDQGSFSQRFPTPEDYLKQFGQNQMHQRQPTVRYVAEANNPFSDQFQGLENKGRGRGTEKKKPGPRKPGKPRGKKAKEAVLPDVDPLQQQQTSSAVRELVSPWHAATPSPLVRDVMQEKSEGTGVPQSPQVQINAGPADRHESIKQENPDGSKDDKDQENTKQDIPAEQHTEAGYGASSEGEAKKDINVAEKESTGDARGVTKEGSESAEKSKGACKGTGLEALQRLESMVADMANEEEACKELEKQSELERLLDENEYDPEMDKIYERDFIEDTPFERSLLSPNKTVGNGSQANSVASLECHEESLISPLFEEPEKRKERQKFFADVSCSETPQVEKKCSDESMGKTESEERNKKEILLTPSIEPSLTPDVTTPVIDSKEDAIEVVDHSRNVSDQSRDQCKQEPIEDTVAIRNEGSMQELGSLDAVGNQGPHENTGTPRELEQSIGTRESVSIGSAASEGIRPAESAVPVSITSSVGPSVNELLNSVNGKDLIVQECKNHQQTPGEAPFGSGRDVCAAFPQQNATNMNSCIVPEAVHETVDQISDTKKYYTADPVQEPTATLPARPVQREKPAKASKQSSRPKNQHGVSDAVAKKKTSTKEEDPIKKQWQELRRQEYERKKREYEEQQKKKRALQQQLRIEKQMIREQRKRQRIYMNPSSRSKQKTEVANTAISLTISTVNNSHKEVKPGNPLSLCEPKLLLTHALTHPYGSRPFNGQCPLKGNFGSAKIDGMVDFYSQFPISGVDVVLGHPPTPPSSLPPSPGVHQHKNDSNEKRLVNGDVSPEHSERAELLASNKAHGSDSERPSKRARYMAVLDSARGGVSVPPSMPTPPLSDSAASSVNDRIADAQSSGKQLLLIRSESNGKESNGNSSSSSPETVQYIASSSPESDALNRMQTPKFSALLHRDSTDSPTFPAVTIKREKVEHVLQNGICPSFNDSCRSISDTHFDETTCCGPRAENDADDLDNIHVSLTLSPTSDQRVTDTVASVAALIGCSPPRRSDIVIEPAGNTVPSSGYLKPTNKLGSSSIAAPMAHTSSDIYQKSPFPSSQVNLSSSEEKCTVKRPEGPYCRHCDVLIIGIGMKRKPDDEETVQGLDTVNSNETARDNADYKIYRVNVEAGDCTGDIFCSEACLKQYFAHVVSECSSLTQDCKSGLSALPSHSDMSVTSVGQTSVGSGNVTTVNGVDCRGGVVADGLSPTSLRKLRSPSWKEEDRDDQGNSCKRQRRLQWKRWQQNEAAKGVNKQRLELSAEEITELLGKHGALKPCADLPDDKRSCTLCGETGDGDNNASARLLNLDVDVWVHLNCALWSLEVYETLNGALMNVDVAVKRGTVTNCVVCLKRGATVSCNQKIGLSKIGCPNNFHFNCAITHGCVFFKDKTMLCHEHRPDTPGMTTDLILSSYAVYRKVYVNRDEIQQIASMLRHNQETNDKPQTLRVGSLVVRSLGQLLPHQLQSFHSRDSVYPVGFKTIRFYWSMHSVNRRCKYHCMVEDAEGIPSFTIRVEDDEQKEQLIFRGKSPRDVWQQILIPILKMRKEAGLVNLFPEYISGEDLFGLSEQFVLRIIESMPGVDQMQGYNMRYGPSPIMELPLAVNPTGSARSEPLLRTHFRSGRARALRSATSSGTAVSPASTVSSGIADESSGLYLKQFVFSKAAQYRKLKTEWKNNVFLGRSNIQGLGLFANKDMEGGSMVIEYIGSIIRNEVANRREQIYEKQNRGVYMFRIDSDAVIDATMAGGPARYINHSCSPNCVAEVVTFEKEQKIIIISNRKVEKGEELTYDYKFDFEDEENKIPCLCGAPNCRKWMN